MRGEQQHGQHGVGGERDESGLRQQRPQFTKRNRLIGDEGFYVQFSAAATEGNKRP